VYSYLVVVGRGRWEEVFTVNFLSLAETAELSWAVIYKALGGGPC